MDKSTNSNTRESSLALLGRQRSHVLFVLSQANRGCDSDFLEWYSRLYAQEVATIDGVLRSQYYEQHEVDITRGQYARLPFRYLGIHDLSLDGASAAGSIIARIHTLHEHRSADRAATWLYYPVSEKVGRSPSDTPSMLTLAFANSVPGRESEFREFYATRHIRHALNIAALVSGQCFERTQYQMSGALEARFHTIAIYEQEGTPDSIIADFSRLPDSTFDFPLMDFSRFAEWTYRPLQSRRSG